MILFNGISSLHQYMLMKPINRGCKVWVRYDQTTNTRKAEDGADMGLGKWLVKDFTRRLVGKAHRVLFDISFNSMKLQKDLLMEKVYAYGAARQNRKNI